MSGFDLFRGFFGLSGRHYRGRRNPFFDTMVRSEEEDEDDEDEDDGFTRRFGFTFGSDGIRMEEPPVFGQVFREMEEMFSKLHHWEGPSGHLGVPGIAPPTPPEQHTHSGEERSGRNPLRDFMLKTPDSDTEGPPRPPHRDPRHSPEFPNSPFQDWTPVFKFNDTWSDGPHGPASNEPKEDRDLDKILDESAVLSQSKPRFSFFSQSVTVTKVIKPDGTVEERRTVTDSEGNKKTEVILSGGPGVLEDPQASAAPPDSRHSFSDMIDDDTLFSKFFKGFK